MGHDGSLGVGLRVAGAGDAADVTRLHHRSLASTYSAFADAPDPSPTALDVWRSEWRDRITRGSVIVAIIDGPVVGFVWYGADPDAPLVGQIHSIHADPTRRGLGIGRALLAAACRTLGSQGRSTAHLWVVEGNERALRFYERAGWERDGASRCEHIEVPGLPTVAVTTVRMRRHLGADGTVDSEPKT